MDEGYPIRSRRGRIAAFVVLAAFLSCLLPVPTPAQPVILEETIVRVASWDLSDGAAAGVIVRQAPVQRTWRNTFGAERRIDQHTGFSGDALKSDVVMLQGVRSIKEVRKIFPARSWKLILSRQLMRQNAGRLNQDTRIEGGAETTAIAVRYQRVLRVTGFEHLLDPVAEAGAASVRPDAAASNPVEAANGDGEASAALALRLNYSGSVFWVVSAVIPSTCHENPQCPSLKSLATWAESKRQQSLGIVFGGRLHNAIRSAGANSACATQEIVADTSLTAEAGADAIAGCLAFVDVKLP